MSGLGCSGWLPGLPAAAPVPCVLKPEHTQLPLLASIGSLTRVINKHFSSRKGLLPTQIYPNLILVLPPPPPRPCTSVSPYLHPPPPPLPVDNFSHRLYRACLAALLKAPTTQAL